MVLFGKNVFPALIMGFFGESQIFLKVGQLENKVKYFFKEKKVFIFLSAFFKKMRRRKTCRW